MTDHDLPPELRRHNSHPDLLTLEVPVEEEPPPRLTPDGMPVPEQPSREPYLRRN